jgi:hypothetical protein
MPWFSRIVSVPTMAAKTDPKGVLIINKSRAIRMLTLFWTLFFRRM